MSIKNISLTISDMVCTSCENRIEKEIKKLNGVKSVKADYKTSKVYIKFDDFNSSTYKITDAIKKAGYTVGDNNKKSSEAFPMLIMVAIAIFIVILGNNSGSFNISESLSSKVSYGVLFTIGIFSSLHCIGMCGGIMISQSITIKESSKFERLKPSLLYNSGRVISYTILGGIVGGLGSVFSLSSLVQGFISIIAGTFMVIIGLNIYGFKALRRFNIKLPWSSCKVSSKKNTPFIVGLLNGFMPCGPLQAMQLYALSTGSIVSGALSMFFFALGTIPLMLLFGVISSLLTKRGTKNLLKISGAIVLVLGISMANRGLAILGVDFTSASDNKETTISTSVENVAVINGDEQTIRISAIASGYSPKTIYVQKGIKTKLIIDGDTLTSCNNEVIFPSLDIRKKLSRGENVIEFTPAEGDINFSCWMGMKRGKIKVVDDINSITQEDESSSDSVAGTEEVEFYGMPLSKVPTSKLIKEMEILDNEQVINVTADKTDFEPLVIVAQEDVPLTINFDVGNLSEIDGMYYLLDSTLSKVISKISIENGKGTLTLEGLESGEYGLIRGNRIFTIIEVVSESDFKSIDKEVLRKKYF